MGWIKKTTVNPSICWTLRQGLSHLHQRKMWDISLIVFYGGGQFTILNSNKSSKSKRIASHSTPSAVLSYQAGSHPPQLPRFLQLWINGVFLHILPLCVSSSLCPLCFMLEAALPRGTDPNAHQHTCPTLPTSCFLFCCFLKVTKYLHQYNYVSREN